MSGQKTSKIFNEVSVSQSGIDQFETLLQSPATFVPFFQANIYQAVPLLVALANSDDAGKDLTAKALATDGIYNKNMQHELAIQLLALTRTLHPDQQADILATNNAVKIFAAAQSFYSDEQTVQGMALALSDAQQARILKADSALDIMLLANDDKLVLNILVNASEQDQIEILSAYNALEGLFNRVGARFAAGLLDTFSAQQQLKLFTAHQTVRTLMARGLDNFVIQTLREAPPKSLARIFSADGALEALSKQEIYPNFVSHALSDLNSDQLIKILTSKRHSPASSEPLKFLLESDDTRALITRTINNAPPEKQAQILATDGNLLCLHNAGLKNLALQVWEALPPAQQSIVAGNLEAKNYLLRAGYELPTAPELKPNL